MPKISIIIPVYNVEQYLRECLDSVRAQTFTDWESICVDDGSTDNSPSILDEYAAKDKRFRIIRREHSNAGACRNAGIDRARGEFLSFLDSDDVFSPKMLEILHDIIERYRADISTCDMVRFRDGDPVPRLDREIKRETIRDFQCPAASLDIFSLWAGRAWDKLFRRQFVEKRAIRFQEIRSSNDTFFTYSAISLAKRVVAVSSVLIAYRESSGSLERTHHLSPSCMGKALESYATEMEKRGVFHNNPSLERFFKLWAVYVLFWNLDIIHTSDGYKEAYSVFSRLCDTFGFRDILGWEETNNRIDLERLRLICDGCSAFDSLLLHKFKLFQEVKQLRPLRGIKHSRSFRLGCIMTWLPRKLKAIVSHR